MKMQKQSGKVIVYVVGLNRGGRQWYVAAKDAKSARRFVAKTKNPTWANTETSYCKKFVEIDSSAIVELPSIIDLNK